MGDSSPAYGLYLLAMTKHQQGNSDAANEHLAAANARAEEELVDGSSWNRTMTLKLFRHEAEALMLSTERQPDRSSEPIRDKPQKHQRIHLMQFRVSRSR
ncbi:MAG: hypothetical protein KDA45_16235 [Planctomycetales bacterium]|nr:hypothetical protein [Planctomycetales bacterium]MCA9169678.1 hypothetical protein [Planctomycetales bacterium]